jgi:hypothetical protein
LISPSSKTAIGLATYSNSESTVLMCLSLNTMDSKQIDNNKLIAWKHSDFAHPFRRNSFPKRTLETVGVTTNKTPSTIYDNQNFLSHLILFAIL